MAAPRQPAVRSTRRAGVQGAGIEIDGLAEFRKALKAVSPEADKKFGGVMRKYGTRALGRARQNTPFESGLLEGSIKLSVTRTNATLTSNSPYARAHEWGAKGLGDSKVKPRGVPIVILRSQMLGNAIYFYRDALSYEMANTVNKVAIENGLDPTTVRRDGSVISTSN